MNNKNEVTFSAALRLQVRRLKDWLKPDPVDHVVAKIVKSFFKGIAILLLLLFSPVLIVGFVLIFFGLM